MDYQSKRVESWGSSAYLCPHSVLTPWVTLCSRGKGCRLCFHPAGMCQQHKVHRTGLLCPAGSPQTQLQTQAKTVIPSLTQHNIVGMLREHPVL